MASTGIINGTKFGVYIGSGPTLIGYGTSCSISISHSPRNTTNSTSGGYTTRMAGTIDWEVSCDALVSMDGSKKYYQMFVSYLDTREVLSVTFKSTTSGDKAFTGYAVMTGLSMDAPNEENATMSVSFAGSGPLAVIDSP